jgi:esterase/lipase superfamily enzyme
MVTKIFKIVLPLCLALILAACSSSHPLVQTPTVYIGDEGYPDHDMPIKLKTTAPEILFVTDRGKEISEDSTILYGSERSTSMAMGAIKVQFGDEISWGKLKTQSEASKRVKDILLEIKDIKELVRFPETPLPFLMKDGNIIPAPQENQDYQKAQHTFREELQKRLDRATKKEVILFIHGFNNTFEEAGLALADIWHFSGRLGVPIFYTWPAANKGLFGYFSDKESGEFTIYHLKEMLRILAAMDSIDKIHIIAHSRGADIMTTALRELVIEARAKDKKAREVLRVENLIMAAPDLDFGIVSQRLIAEKFGPAIGQITVYMNQSDGALGIAQYLLSGLRFGRITENDLSENEQKILGSITNVNFIDVKGVSGLVGHDYYREHPGVLSDIALIIRTGAYPGTIERPLKHNKFNFWTLSEKYPDN